ncbi:hypothetical protein DL691_22100 [Escherichia coli]|nr:hypothetical protein [Escherichia coli]EGD9106360.1 hypothetical protein [Escherichia coli]EGE2361100.1 hypothetical protein [Escherichia coli]KXP80736.1 hypothetical protein AUP77_19225 [Escherichia coli]
MQVPHEMNEDEKCSKNKLYGPVLVLGERCNQGEGHRNNMCFSLGLLHAIRTRIVARIWQVSQSTMYQEQTLLTSQCVNQW